MAVERVKGEVVGVSAKANEPLKPVVSTVVKTKKSSALKSLWKGFFAEDLKTVAKDTFKNVITQSIKTGIANAVTSAVYMWLFGKNGYSTGPGGVYRPLFSNTTTNYANAYRVQNSPNSVAPTGPKVSVDNPGLGSYRSTDVYDPEYIRYGSWQDAENVYSGLCNRIANYSVATVRNLYDLSNVSNPEVILQNWGWYDIPWHRVVPLADGTWILKMPQPCYLNGK